MIGPVAFLVTVLFAPGLAGAATTPRWAILAIFVPWLLPTSFKFTLGHLLMFGYFLWAAASLTWAADIYSGLLVIVQLALILGLFCIGGTLQSLRPVYIGMALALGVSSVVSIAQVNGWNAIDQVSPPGGLFFNSNFMAEAAVMVVVALIAERLYWFVPFVLPAAFLPMARGAIVALIVSLVIWTKSRVIGLMLVVSLIGISGYYAYSNHRTAPVYERFAIWHDAIDGMTFWGNGAGSFYLRYPATATRTNTLKSRPDHAHNDLLESVFELGPGALLLVGVGFVAWRVGRDQAAKRVLIAFAIIGIFGFPLHNAVTAFLFALVAGHLCSAGHPVRAVFDSWRDDFRDRYARRTLRYVASRRVYLAF